VIVPSRTQREVAGKLRQNAASIARSSRATVIPVSANSPRRAQPDRSLLSRHESGTPATASSGRPESATRGGDHPSQNSLLLRASSASFSCAALDTAKIPGIRHAVKLPLQQSLTGGPGQKRERLRQYSEKGADSKRCTSRRDSVLGTPSHRASLPTRVAAGPGGTSIASVQNSRRVVARTSFTGPAGNGTWRRSPLTSSARYSRRDEYQTSPRRYDRSASGSYLASEALTAAQVSRKSRARPQAQDRRSLPECAPAPAKQCLPSTRPPAGTDGQIQFIHHQCLAGSRS